MQEHVDAAEVVGREVDLLTEKALPDVLFAEHTLHLEEQRAGAASRIVDLVDGRFADGAESRQQLRYVCGRKVLSALFAGVGGVHAHQIFIRVAEQIRVDALCAVKRHPRNAVQQRKQHLVALRNGLADGLAVDVEIIEQTRKAALGLAALCGIFDVVEDHLQALVEVVLHALGIAFAIGENGGVGFCRCAEIFKQLRRKHEETLFFDQAFASAFGVCVGHLCIVKACVTGGALALVDVSG